MSESMHYDTELLFKQANKLLDHVETHRQNDIGHIADCAEMASRWAGPIGAAMQAMSEGWATQGEALREQVGRHASWIMQVATEVSGTDDGNAGRLGRAENGA